MNEDPFIISCPYASYEKEGKLLQNYLIKKTGFKSNLIADYLNKAPSERGSSDYHAMKEAITKSSVVFFVMTLNAYAHRGSGFDSPGLQAEFAMAYALNKEIVPVFVNEKNAPPPYWMFDSYQTFELYTSGSMIDEKRNKKVNYLLEDLYMKYGD